MNDQATLEQGPRGGLIYKLTLFSSHVIYFEYFLQGLHESF